MSYHLSKKDILGLLLLRQSLLRECSNHETDYTMKDSATTSSVQEAGVAYTPCATNLLFNMYRVHFKWNGETILL
jgi:hypothetical protein